MPEDEGNARMLLDAAFDGTRYLARLREQIGAALQFEDPEYMAILAVGPHDDALRGLALFGTVAGTRQCVKLHAIVSADPTVSVALAEGIAEVCARSGERLIVCELPDDAPFRSVADALLGDGYAEEGRVADYVRDGVDLRLLVRRL
jgi:hypothetical protein